MAKFKPGIAIGDISGSVAGNTFSHNRHGRYIRDRVVPTKVTSTYATDAKARLSRLSKAWQSLTQNQRDAWQVYAQNNPITDVLGDKQVLTGHTMYIGVNARIDWIGSPVLSVPPVGASPASLTSLSVVGDISDSKVELTYAPTPTASGFLIWVALTDSAAQQYAANKMRLTKFVGSGVASAQNIWTEVVARFGSLQAGQYVTVEMAPFDPNTGLGGRALKAAATIVA
jgi:hypothetical protein